VSKNWERPRPRVVLIGFGEDDVDRFEAIFPTVWAFPRADLARTACEPSEVDLVVSSNGLANYFETNHTILFSPHADSLPSASVHVNLRLDRSAGEEFEVVSGAPTALETVQDVLVEELHRQKRGAWGKLVIKPQGVLHAMAGLPALQGAPNLEGEGASVFRDALLTTKTPAGALAIVTFSHTGHGLAWFPNGFSGDKVACVRAVLLHWSGRLGDVFPGIADWEKALQWATREEATVIEALSAHDGEAKAVLEGIKARRREIEEKLAAARDRGSAGARRILTAAGEPLVAAVAEVLRDLGFDVENMDAQLAPNAPRREDLRLRTGGDWEAIAEVKGYQTSGGKTADLQQVQNHARFYVATKKRQPAKLFYIVNQHYGVPPEMRRRALVGSDDDIAMFGEGGGLVISTLDLFRLHRDLDVVISRERARELLVSTTRLFVYPSAPEPAPDEVSTST
jgi:hypothetical protein